MNSLASRLNIRKLSNGCVFFPVLSDANQKNGK